MPPEEPPADSLTTSSTLAVLTQLADHAGDGLLAFDRDLRCLYANRAARRLAGAGTDAAARGRAGTADRDDPGPWLGRSADEAFPFIPAAQLRQALDGQAATSRGGALPAPILAEPRFFDGQYFALRGPAGDVIGVAAVIRDVTSHQRVAPGDGRDREPLPQHGRRVAGAALDGRHRRAVHVLQPDLARPSPAAASRRNGASAGPRTCTSRTSSAA